MAFVPSVIFELVVAMVNVPLIVNVTFAPKVRLPVDRVTLLSVWLTDASKVPPIMSRSFVAGSVFAAVFFNSKTKHFYYLQGNADKNDIQTYEPVYLKTFNTFKFTFPMLAILAFSS